MKIRKPWLVILVIIIVVSGCFLLNYLTLISPSNTAKGSENNLNGLPIILVAIGVTIASIISFFSDSIRNALSFFFTDQKGREDQIQRMELEKEYLENLYERLNSDTPWEIRKFAELEALNNGLSMSARKGRPRKLRKFLRDRSSILEEEVRSKVTVRNYLEKEVLRDKPVMLKGEPGSGKTMMARRFTADIAHKARNGYSPWTKKPLLPIYIRLNAYNTLDSSSQPEPFLNFLKSYLEKEYEFAGVIAENLNALLISGRLILVLDGLNEMPESKLRIINIENFFRKQYPRTKCLITCRNIQFTSVDYKTLEINELSNDQIRKFIEIYQGNDWIEPVFDELSSSRGIAFKRFRNPFILTIYLQRDFIKSPPPASLARLYSEYVDRKFSDHEYDHEILIENLKKISFSMSTSGLFAGYVDISELENQIEINFSDNFLQKCASANIVDLSLNGKFRFYHQIFQEYFSALVLDDLARNGKEYRKYLHDPAWEEIVLVWGGIVDDLPALITDVLVKNVKVRELCLALKLCSANPGRIKSEEVDKIIKLAKPIFLGNKIIPKIETLKALGILETKTSIGLLGEILHNSVGWVRELCIQILGKSENEEAKSQLKLCLKSITSFQAFIQARYFLPFNTWMLLYIRNQLSLRLILNFLTKLWYLGLIFIPMLMMGLLFRGAVSTKLDPIVLIGRVLSVFFTFLLLKDIWRNIKYAREDNLKLNWSVLSSLVGVGEIINIISIVLLFFFPYELFSFVGIILSISFYGFVAYLIYLLGRSILKPARIFDILLKKARILGILVLLLISAYFFRLYGPEWTRDINVTSKSEKGENVMSKVKFDQKSPVTVALDNVKDFIDKYITLSMLKAGAILGALSILAHLVTYILYVVVWIRFKRWNRSESQKDVKALLSLVKSSLVWISVKTHILQRLRKSTLPARYLNDLETYRDSEDEVMRELERTVYELKHAS